MLSPVGSTADTRSLECEIVTCACGAKPGVAESAEGFLGRSTMVAGVEQGRTSELWCEGSDGLRVLGRGYTGKSRVNEVRVVITMSNRRRGPRESERR
jgi:hypothetical protein